MGMRHLSAWYKKKVMGARETELQMVGTNMWVLGTNPRSCARAASAVNCYDTSPAPALLLMII